MLISKTKKIINLLLNNNICLALLINFLFLFMIFLFCDMKYEVSDDFVMSSILSGAYGHTQNPQMIYVNVLLGYLLIPFYKIMPAISWYFVFQIGLIFISSTALIFFLLEQLARAKALMLSLLFILFYVNDAYILVQFTKTATLAVMVGSILFIRELFARKRVIRILFGAFLCILGTSVRFGAINIVGGFLIYIIIYELIMMINNRKNWIVLIKNLIFAALCGSFLISIAFGINKLNWYTFNNDESYGFFYSYSSARSNILDYNSVDYNTIAKKLNEIGLSENDYYMIKSWNLGDNEVFSLEKMQQVSEIIQSSHNDNPVNLEEIFQKIQSRKITSYTVFLGFIILLFIGIFLNTRMWWSSLICCGISGGILMYFAYMDRCVYRTEFSTFLAAFICGLYFWHDNVNQIEAPPTKTHQTNYVCSIVALICLLWNIVLYIPDSTYKTINNSTRKDYIDEVFYNSWDFNSRKYRRVVNKSKPTNGLLSEFENNPDNFYFLDFNSTIQTLYFEYPPLQALPVNYYNNFTYLAGIQTNFPDVTAALEDKGVSNPLPSLIKEDIYLVDNQTVEQKLIFLREHYYPNAWVELYKQIDGYSIWKFYEN